MTFKICQTGPSTISLVREFGNCESSNGCLWTYLRLFIVVLSCCVASCTCLHMLGVLVLFLGSNLSSNSNFYVSVVFSHVLMNSVAFILFQKCGTFLTCVIGFKDLCYDKVTITLGQRHL